MTPHNTSNRRAHEGPDDLEEARSSRWKQQMLPYLLRVLKLAAGSIIAMAVIFKLLAVLIDEQTVYGALNLPSKDYVDRQLGNCKEDEKQHFDSLMTVLADIHRVVSQSKLNLDTLSTRQNYSALIQALAIGCYSRQEEGDLLMKFAEGKLNTDELLRQAYSRRKPR